MFDIDQLFTIVQAAIREFAASHPDKTFYAFAIDADMLCLNSEENFAESLVKYQANYPDDYDDEDNIQELKHNTGDWHYQGFFDLEDEHGFDADAYSDHYGEAGDSDDGTAPHTPYAKAMSALIAKLQGSDVFEPLKRTDDFRISWVDHSY